MFGGAVGLVAVCLLWNTLRVPAARRLSLAQFEQRRAQPDTVVLDVRSPAEFAAGHVPGAININVMAGTFAPQAAALDKTKTYLVHCARGGRSALAVRRMARMGFGQLYDFSGGWNEWAAAKPAEKAPGR